MPIEIDDYLDLHMNSNPDENRDDLRSGLEAALAAHQAGATCHCGNPIWVIGSALAGRACFTCITGNAVPEDDYEIAQACSGGDV